MATGDLRRVEKAIAGEAPDRLPRGELVLGDQLIKTQANAKHAGFEEKLKFVHSLGHDLICLAPGYEVPHYEATGELPPAAALKIKEIERWVLETPLFVFAMLDGVLGWGTRYFGYTNFLTLPKRSPLTFTDFAKKVTALNTELIKKVAAQGVHALLIADDLAYQQGLMYNPKTLDKYYYTALEAQVEVLKGSLPVFFHSDGCYEQIIPSLINCGITGLQCLEEGAGMDPLFIKEEYPELCLWGTLEVKDLEKVKEEAFLRALLLKISKLSQGGRFILGTTCGLFEGINLRALVKIYEALEIKR